VGALCFLCFKPMYREAWRVVLPIWCFLCALVGALCEWQVGDEPTDGGGPNGDEQR